MRYRACPRCQEVLPEGEFFCATNPDPMHTPLCGYCLGVQARHGRLDIDAVLPPADRTLFAARAARRPVRSLVS
jgi:hypothetical protein